MKKRIYAKTAAAALLLIIAGLCLCGCVNTDEEPVQRMDPAAIPTVYVPTLAPRVTELPQVNTHAPSTPQMVITMPPAAETPVPQQTPGGNVPVITNVPTAEPPSKSVKLGDRGDAVKAIQQKLIRLGFLSGKADGIFGEATEKAVKDFQTQYKLTVQSYGREKL